MKKLFMFLTVAAMSASLSAAEMNIYASGLKAGDVDASNKVEINYLLNAPATAVTLQLIQNDAVVKEIAITGEANLTKGAHAVTVDLSVADPGTYNWAIKAAAAANEGVEPVLVGTFGEGQAMGRAVTIDKNPESPFYGNVYTINGKAVGVYGYDAALNPLFDTVAVAKNGWGTGNSAPCRGRVGEDGLLYLCDWSDSNPNVRIFNPATPAADAIDVFGGKASGSDGIMVNELGDTINGSLSYCYPVGSGENTVLFTADEDYKQDGKLTIYKYAIGEAKTVYTTKPEVALAVGALTSGKIANANVTFLPSKTGGWWVSQHRYSDTSGNPSLVHIAGDTINYNSAGALANATVGYNNQASFDINNEQDILISSTSNSVFSILVWDIVWTDGVPALTLKYTIPSGFNNTMLQCAIDEAGNIYGVCAGKPLTVWALPKADNSCVTPAKKASVLTVAKSATALEDLTGMAPGRKGVFTITGQYLGESVQNLPAGMYIVNGQKMIIR